MDVFLKKLQHISNQDLPPRLQRSLQGSRESYEGAATPLTLTEAFWRDEKSLTVSLNQMHRTKCQNINCMCKVNYMSQTLPNVTWQNVTNVTKRYITKACIKTDPSYGFLNWRCWGVDQYLLRHLCWSELKIQPHFTEFGVWSYIGQEPSFVRSHKRDRALHGFIFDLGRSLVFLRVSAFWLYQVLLESNKNINIACVC